MAGKKRVRFRGTKPTSKRLEADILDRSKKLADEPSILRPMCAGNCRKCSFDKTFKLIDSYQGIKGNADALIKEASRGSDDIAKAYAGTISLNAAGTVPMLATAKLAGEPVSFAVRGLVGNDKLIGCQYYTDSKKRLLLYNNFIKKNKLHLYSFEEGLVCSNKPNMPEDYLYDAFWDTPYEFENDGLQCKHESPATLVIKIKSLDEEIRICRNCAKDVSTLQFIVSKISANDPLDDIEVYIEHKYHNESTEGRDIIKKDLLEKYMVGAHTDASLINVITKDKLGELKSAAVATYIVGTKNYGSDLKTFISDLTGSSNEIDALEAYLSAVPSAVIIKTGKASEALSMLWTDNWKDIIAKFTSESVAESMGNLSKSVPGPVLDEAHRKYIMSGVSSEYPEFKRAGKITLLSDRLAKAFKVGGGDLVYSEINSISPKDSKSRVMCKSFLIATGHNGEVAWKMTSDESEYADYLLPFVKNLIDAPPAKYSEAMGTLLTASGCGESI